MEYALMSPQMTDLPNPDRLLRLLSSLLQLLPQGIDQPPTRIRTSTIPRPMRANIDVPALPLAPLTHHLSPAELTHKISRLQIDRPLPSDFPRAIPSS